MENTNFIYKTNVVDSLIAETQGEIYELADKLGYDIKDFSDKYLRSDFCKNEMDSVYSKYQTEFADECLNIVLAEFAEKNIKVQKVQSLPKQIYYSPYSVGVLYRHLCFGLNVTSEELSHIISFDEIANYSIELEEYEIEEIVPEIILKYK